MNGLLSCTLLSLQVNGYLLVVDDELHNLCLLVNYCFFKNGTMLRRVFSPLESCAAFASLYQVVNERVSTKYNFDISSRLIKMQ